VLAIRDDAPYDLICLDIMMPKVDGVRVLKAIRDVEKQKGIKTDNRTKVIMTTPLPTQILYSRLLI
jgi:two-component system chemotaxis response regulator CheY